MLYALTLIIIVLLFLRFYVMQKRKFRFWEKLCINTLPSHNILFGDFTKYFCGKESLYAIIENLYKETRQKNEDFIGLYFCNIPTLLIVDLELVKDVLIRNFDHFQDRLSTDIDIDKEPLNAHLFLSKYDKWHGMRQKVSPMFTKAKLKLVFPALLKHVDKLCVIVNQNGLVDVDMKPKLERLGIDIIGEIAFGIDSNTQHNKNLIFYEMAMRVFNFKPLKALQILLFDNSPSLSINDLVRLTGINKELCEYFTNLIRNTVQHRLENNIEANDLLQVMIKAMEENPDISIQKITSEAFLFFIAAFETFTGSVNYTLYELSKNVSVQEKLRNEIRSSRIDYDFIMTNKLLDSIVKETLRKHTVVPLLFRTCTKEYELKSGIVLKPGMHLLIPVSGIHNDEHYYTNPNVYDPSRFLDDTGPYFTFGDGPRFCIGKPLGLLQVKLTIVRLIQEFSFTTRLNEELEHTPLSTSTITQYKQKITFDISKI